MDLKEEERERMEWTDTDCTAYF